MHSSRDIPVAEDQPNVTIDLGWILRDLGLESVGCLHEAGDTLQWSTCDRSNGRGIDLEQRDVALMERMALEQIFALPAPDEHDGGFLSHAAVFLRDRWRGDFLTAGMGFLIGNAAKRL